MLTHLRSLGLTVLAGAAAGCGLFIHPTPISKVPESDREPVGRYGGSLLTVRLTKPAKVSGFDLAPGSVIRPDGRDYQIQTAEEITVSGVVVPAGSWFELIKATSIVVGDRYNWNGVVHFGGPHAYGMIEAQQGDRGFFTGSLFSNAQLTQIAIATPRAMGGRMLPAGSIVDLRDDGQIKETFTPGEQQELAREREERRQERERKEQRCREACAPVIELGANAQCMANCRG